MEALILIFGELIFAALAPFVALVVEVLGAIVSGIIAAVSGKRAENSAVPRVAKIFVKVFATLTAIGFMAVLVVNFSSSTVPYDSSWKNWKTVHRL